MSQKDNIIFSYLLPIVLTILLIVMSEVLGLIEFPDLLMAAVLFAVIGFSIFLAEVLISKSRKSERNETYTLITSLLLTGRAKDASSILNLNELYAIEASAEEVWIYAYNLEWEDESNGLTDIVLENLKRGARYRYIVPNNKQTQIRVTGLLQKYGIVKDVDRLVKYRCRPRELKLVQFGIAIYNPSISMRGKRASDGCVAVFFPHYSSFGPKTDHTFFIAVRGHSTIEIQEGFLELWDEATEVVPIKEREIE